MKHKKQVAITIALLITSGIIQAFIWTTFSEPKMTTKTLKPSINTKQTTTTKPKFIGPPEATVITPTTAKPKIIKETIVDDTMTRQCAQAFYDLYAAVNGFRYAATTLADPETQAQGWEQYNAAESLAGKIYDRNKACEQYASISNNFG